MLTVEPIQFEAVLTCVNEHAILRLPAAKSAMLPSRGPVALSGTLNGHHLCTLAEADGAKGHWMRVDAKLLQAAGIRAGDGVVPRQCTD